MTDQTPNVDTPDAQTPGYPGYPGYPDAPETTESPETPESEKLEQTVNIEDAGPARKKITIEIPDARINEKIDGNLNDLQTEAVLPGFRRGRAPMRLIEKRFGTDVRNEAKTQLMAESYQQVIEENELRVIGEPDIKDIDDIKLPEEGNFTFEVEVEIVPEFELPDLKGLKVEKTKADVTDAQVTAEIDRYCEMQGKMASTDQPAEPNDYLTADVEIKTEDGETAGHQAGGDDPRARSQGPDQGPRAGRRILVDDLAEHLVGKKAGESVTIEATGPKQHENESLREAKLTLDIKIAKAERMEKAPVQDILQAFGMDSEDEFKEQIKLNLEQRAEQQQHQDMQKQVTDAILEKIEFDLPEGLSGRQPSGSSSVAPWK
jgi:trigger factor